MVVVHHMPLFYQWPIHMIKITALDMEKGPVAGEARGEKLPAEGL